MKHKIFFIGALFCLSSHLHAVIVFLKGTGCAGKTSLCSALLTADSSWKIVDEDALYIKEAVDNFRNTFAQEFGHIETAIAQENIFHAIKRNQILFKETATAQEKTEAEIVIYSIKKRLDQCTSINKRTNNEWHDELKAQLLSSIRERADAGFNVIVDSWLLEPQHIEMLRQEYKVAIVLTYCPFKELVNRTLTRNYHALLNKNLYAMRYFHQPLMSFMKLYDFQAEPSEQAIDTITREEINNALDVVELALVCSNNLCGGSVDIFSREEFSRSQLYEYRTSLMGKFLDTDILYVIPKNSIDCVIKTMGINAQEGAQQFLSKLESVA